MSRREAISDRLQTTWHARRRRGISLLEVLISMFVLAVGLLGVAALIPAGRSEIAQGSRLENAAMIGRSVFRDLQVRGWLQPQAWRDPTDTFNVWQPFAPPGGTWNQRDNDPAYYPPFTSDNGNTYTNAVVIDPLGVFANYDAQFPHGVDFANDPHLARVVPNSSFAGAPGRQLADLFFRASHDLVTEENGDLPPLSEWFQDANGLNLRRASAGNYSWLATVVIEPTAFVRSDQPAPIRRATVSVAVFHKRDLSVPGGGEFLTLRGTPVVLNSGGIGGGEARMENITSYASPAQPVKPMRSGQWIMLAGRLPVPATFNAFNFDYFRWYRVVAAQELETGPPPKPAQNVTLAGPDWRNDANLDAMAYIFDNVVAVYEKELTLEIR